MGSSGSGRISDYPGSSSSAEAGGEGGASGLGAEDRCARAFSTRLEDIEQSEFYQLHGSFPPIGTQVEVARRKRLVAQTSQGESIGNLPTTLNHLAACKGAGWVYIGQVQSVALGPPVASIQVDFAATQP